MSITISSISSVLPVPSSTTVTSDRGASSSPAAAPSVPSDTVTLGASEPVTPTYSDPRTSKAVVNQPDLVALLEQSNQQTQAIINLILPLMRDQGLNFAKVISGAQAFYADAADIAKAKAAIAEDGTYGVLQVASRILDFARNAIGNDPTKLEKIRAAVESGFKSAKEALGGALPEISQQTHDAIFAEFDRWQSEGIPKGEVKLSAPASAAAPSAGSSKASAST